MDRDLESIEKQYRQLQEKLSSPEVLNDKERYGQYAKELAAMTPVANKIGEYREIVQGLSEVKELLRADNDSEMTAYLQEEHGKLVQRRDAAEHEIDELLRPKDEFENKNIIVEIRAGAGGDEASLFAADLYRMYSHYSQARGWKNQVMSSSPTPGGGFKEIIFEVKGENAFGFLKFESGVHRVQRVPVTESSGRIHTSTATVAVLPEAEEVDVKIDPKDLHFDTYRSAGPGGQHVNVTDSAVRITHEPSGLVVSCQEERSQFQNKERALKILRTRLFEMTRQAQRDEIDEARRSQVGSGERSEKIRTYNFPQNRVTDHRIGLTVHNLQGVLQGSLDELLEALREAGRVEAGTGIE